MKKLLMILSLFFLYNYSFADHILCNLITNQAGAITDELAKDPGTGGLIGTVVPKEKVTAIFQSAIGAICPQVATAVSNLLKSEQAQICQALQANLLPVIEARIKEFLASDALKAEISKSVPQVPFVGDMITKTILQRANDLVPQLKQTLIDQCPTLTQTIADLIVK